MGSDGVTYPCSCPFEWPGVSSLASSSSVFASANENREDVMYTRATSFSGDSTGRVLQALISSIFFAVLTGVGAQISVRLPVAPVPLTLQVLLVVVSGLALGGKRGWACQAGYLAAGFVGLPVFSGATGGPLVLLGPTAGYLLAFPAAAFAAGMLRESVTGWNWWGSYAASCVAVALIYCGGAAWLSCWLSLVGEGSSTSGLATVWRLGVMPFLLVDLAKALVAAAVVGGADYVMIHVRSVTEGSVWRGW